MVDVCSIFSSDPSVPTGSCFLYSNNNIAQIVAGFKKCCGPAPVAQDYSSVAHECLIYCPLVEDGPSQDDLITCLSSEIGSAGCIGDDHPASPSDVDHASYLAETPGLCSACVARTATTVQTTAATTTDSESTASDPATDTTEGNSNTATVTAAPTRAGTTRATAATTSSTSTNAAVGFHQVDPIPWKIGFTMGAMVLTGAIAGLLI
jgi:hypothetical protein